MEREPYEIFSFALIYKYLSLFDKPVKQTLQLY